MGVKAGVADGADSRYRNLVSRDAAALELEDIRLPKIEVALADGKATCFEGLREFH